VLSLNDLTSRSTTAKTYRAALQEIRRNARKRELVELVEERRKKWLEGQQQKERAGVDVQQGRPRPSEARATRPFSVGQVLDYHRLVGSGVVVGGSPATSQSEGGGDPPNPRFEVGMGGKPELYVDGNGEIPDPPRATEEGDESRVGGWNESRSGANLAQPPSYHDGHDSEEEVVHTLFLEARVGVMRTAYSNWPFHVKLFNTEAPRA
jgi:hypothetical protein